MKIGFWLAMTGALMASAAAQAQSHDEAAIAAMSLDDVVIAIVEDRDALRGYLEEVNRRYPDDPTPIAFDAPPPSAEERARIAGLDDDALTAEVEAIGTDIDRLVARGEALKASGATLSPDIAAIAAQLGGEQP